MITGLAACFFGAVKVSDVKKRKVKGWRLELFFAFFWAEIETRFGIRRFSTMAPAPVLVAGGGWQVTGGWICTHTPTYQR